MIEGISDSIIASGIGKIVKYIWDSDFVSKVRYYILNPNIYCKYRYLKKFNQFNYNLTDIKKLIFNNINDNYLNKIDYVGHGKNYLNFIIKDSNSSYRLEIINDVNVNNVIDEDYDDSKLLLKIISTSPSVVRYRDCNYMIDLKIINHISKCIEKKYKIMPTFESYELISSGNENVLYPSGNVSKVEIGMNQVIYNEQSIAIKSHVYDDLIICLDKFKFKLLKDNTVSFK